MREACATILFEEFHSMQIHHEPAKRSEEARVSRKQPERGVS